MAGVERMALFPDVQRGYARDPVTWLNQAGWEDVPPANSRREPKLYERRVTSTGQVQEWDGFDWGTRNDLTVNAAGEVVQRVLS